MDQALQNCLHPSPEPMKALYIYESTMVVQKKLFVYSAVVDERFVDKTAILRK